MNLLKNRNYLLLRSGWSISSLGTQLQAFAFSLYVLAKTGSATQFSVTLCMEILPMILFAPFSGYLADRFDRKRQIILYDILSAASVFLLLTLYLLNRSLEVYQIYLCVFALSALNTFTNSVGGCLIQAAVNPDNYTRQRSVDSTISSLITIFAPALAGALFGIWGIGPVLILNAASFLISALTESFISLPSAPKSNEPFSLRGFTGSMREGLQAVSNNPFIRSFIFTLSLLNFVLPSVEIGLMVVSNKLMHLSPAMIGLESSLLSLGTLAGALICGVFSKRLEKVSFRRIIAFAVSATATAFLLIGLWLWLFYPLLNMAGNIAVYVALNLIIILANSILSINLAAQFQREVPNEVMGRTGAFVNAALTVCTPLGQITAGAMMGGFPYSAAYLVEGGLCFILFLASMKKSRKSAIITSGGEECSAAGGD